MRCVVSRTLAVGATTSRTATHHGRGRQRRLAHFYLA